MTSSNSIYTKNSTALISLSLRLVVGWTYFSAFWRRLVLENKLIEDAPGYIGEKFNHFLPQALGIKPLIEYLVTHPDALHASMVAFTIVEAIVGLLLMLGLFSRLMSIGVVGLALGILLGSGWIGTTCLDEWQIGVLGIAGGLSLFLTASPAYSIDGLLLKKDYGFTRTKAFAWLGSGELDIMRYKKMFLTISLIIFGLTLYTNQVFHGGVWGKLHNKSVKPKVEISHVVKKNNTLTFEVYRTEGVDVYGSFLIEIAILDNQNKVVKSWKMDDLAHFPKEQIHNHYVVKVKPGKYSLILPLGGKADLTLKLDDLKLGKNAKLKLIDISGKSWTTQIP